MAETASEWEDLMARLVAQADIEGIPPSYAANEAPYKIFKSGDGFVVKNNAGMTKARFKDRASALKYLRALYANVPGASRKADRTKWSGKAPAPKKAG